MAFFIDISEMSPKKLYCYFFYAFYRVWLNIDNGFGATGIFQTSSKALICMSAIEIWLMFSIGIYIGHIFNIHIPFLSFFVFTPLIILLVIKWFIFDSGDKWKNYVIEFNKWPSQKNKIGFWIVGLTILAIILNFIYAVKLNLQPKGLKW